MKRFLIAVAVMLLLAPACSGGAVTRTVLVDYSSDEFASFLLSNFPNKIDVTPGTTVVVHQTWTGEPHTFSGGTKVNDYLAVMTPFIDFFVAYGQLQSAGVPLPDPNNPGNATVAGFARAVNQSKPSPDKTKLIEAFKVLRARDKHFPDLNHPPAEPFKVFSS